MKIINHKTMAAGAETRPRSSTIDSDATIKPSSPTAATALNGSSMAGTQTRPRSSTVNSDATVKPSRPTTTTGPQPRPRATITGSNTTIKVNNGPVATNCNNAPLNDNPICHAPLHGSPMPLGAAVFTDAQVPNTADGNEATVSNTSNNKQTFLAKVLANIVARYRSLINGDPKTSSIATTAGSFDTDGAKTRALWAIVADVQPRYREGEETETEMETQTCRCGQCKCRGGKGQCLTLRMWMTFTVVFGVVWAALFAVLWVVVAPWVLRG